LSECKDQSDIQTFKEDSGFSESEYKWVWDNLLTDGEKERLRQVVKTSQMSLVDPKPTSPTNGDKSDRAANTKIENLTIGDHVWVKSEQVWAQITEIDRFDSTVKCDHRTFSSWFGIDEVELSPIAPE
jgi:hypothetical protein